MFCEVFDEKIIAENIKKIFHIFSVIENNHEKIQKKIIDIRKILSEVKNNKTLNNKQSLSYLHFQIDLLHNEKEYTNNIKNILLSQISKEMVLIYDDIIMVLSSLENLEMEQDEEKNNLINKIIYFKKVDNFNHNNTLQLTNIILNNLELIEKFINLFENYIREKSSKNNIDNIHCNSFYTNMMNKKNHILLEYRKYSDNFNELITYFENCSEALVKQISRSDIINFLVEKNIK